MKVLLQPVQGGFDVYTVKEENKERLNERPVPRDKAHWAKNEIYSGRMDASEVKASFAPVAKPKAKRTRKAKKSV